jgi:hypothetical protein
MFLPSSPNFKVEESKFIPIEAPPPPLRQTPVSEEKKIEGVKSFNTELISKYYDISNKTLTDLVLCI